MPNEQISQDIGRLMEASQSLSNALERVRGELQQLGSTVQENGSRLAAMEAQLEQACQQLGELRRSVLHGNGQPPLASRVQENADRIRAIEEATVDMVRDYKRQTTAIVLSRGQIAAALIGLIGAVVTSFVSMVVMLLNR